MATNNFKPFATAENANVTAQADWEALPALLSGFTAGKASSAQVNKAIRQASFIAAALAQYTANKSGLDVLDDGDLNGFISKMGTAFGKDFQALDATLTALAGLATGENKLPYFTGPKAASLADLTAFAREILAQTDAAGVLSKLGLGDAAKLNVGTTAGTVAAGNDARFGLMIGVGQTWVNVTSIRASKTTYTNDTGKPILVLVSSYAASADANFIVDGVAVALIGYNASTTIVRPVSAIVPAGSTYSVSNTIGSQYMWSELR